MTKPLDLTKLLKDYKSGWVALSKNYKEVVAWAPSLEKLDVKLEEVGEKDVVVISASQNYRGFIT